MGRIEDRLAELGLELPTPFEAPAGVSFRFETVRIDDRFAYVSGHGPTAGSKTLLAGKVGDTVSLDDAVIAARLTGLAILSSLRETVGDLDRVTGWVKAFGMVNCAPGFNKMPVVINGFSELLIELWGDAGRHARSAIGVAELPFDWPVEVEAIARLNG